MKIYRVMCTDSYQQTTAETAWHTSREYCESYKNNSSYKHLLYIEDAELIVDENNKL